MPICIKKGNRFFSSEATNIIEKRQPPETYDPPSFLPDCTARTVLFFKSCNNHLLLTQCQMQIRSTGCSLAYKVSCKQFHLARSTKGSQLGNSFRAPFLKGKFDVWRHFQHNYRNSRGDRLNLLDAKLPLT